LVMLSAGDLPAEVAIPVESCVEAAADDKYSVYFLGNIDNELSNGGV